MKIINYEDIRKMNISLNECIEWVKEDLSIKDACYLPPKSSIKPEKDIFFTSMPCLIPNENIYGLKMVSRIPQNQEPALNSTIMLFNSMTGQILSIMDCNWITAMRTGAVAALSVLKLAKKDFKIISCIGLGNTCMATLDILLDQIKDRSVVLRLKKYKNHHERIIDRYKNYSNVSFEIVEDMESFISNSDIIISCVTSTNEILGKDEWFKEGVTVIPVHTMGFQNCDLFFDKVIVDDIKHVEGFKYYKEFKNVTELKDIINMDTARDNDFQRIIAYNVGIALHDVYFASKIYKKASFIEECEFENDKQKYWL